MYELGSRPSLYACLLKGAVGIKLSAYLSSPRRSALRVVLVPINDPNTPPRTEVDVFRDVAQERLFVQRVRPQWPRTWIGDQRLNVLAIYRGGGGPVPFSQLRTA